MAKIFKIRVLIAYDGIMSVIGMSEIGDLPPPIADVGVDIAEVFDAFEPAY